MNRKGWLLAALASMSLAACVTINVYFPAAAAEKAADRIIDEVWGEQTGRKPEGERQGFRVPQPGAPRRLALVAVPQGPSPVPRIGDGAFVEPGVPPAVAQLLLAALDLLVPAAHAQANIDISSPAVNALKSSMSARHASLLPHYNSGAVGLTARGLVAVRDASAVPLTQRAQVNQLVAAENRDRNALYQAIAEANGHPEWEPDIRATFARRWIERAQPGWWYESGGGWQQR